MEFYAALILALTLAAIAGLLYFYVLFLEARSRQQQRRITQLERAYEELFGELHETEGRLEEPGRDFWPEVIDEGGHPKR